MQRLWTLAALLACASGLSACGVAPSGADDAQLAASTAEALLTGTATLVAGSSTSGGYDFSAGVYTGVSAGDFYFTQGKFWANNSGQRGVVDAGKCSSVSAVTTMPASGYTLSGVKAVVGHCYVALTHNDERDHIVFRVTARSSTRTTFAWKLVQSGDWGATLVDGSHTAGGYDFDTRTYTDLTPGDFYFTQGAFWANNLGQRGVVGLGPCAAVESVAKTPQTGYWRSSTTATVGSCYASLAHNEEHSTILFRIDAMTATTVTLTWKLVDDCYGYSDPRQSVNCWLTQTPGVSSYVSWENRVSVGVTSVLSWPQWTNAQRDELRADVLGFEAVLANPAAADPDPLVDPPVNQQTLLDTDFAVGVLSSDDAWRLYVKTVAMSLAVELTQYVPWSVTSSSYDATSLASLFDSRHTVSYTWPGAPANPGWATPSAEGYILVLNNYDASTHSTFSPSASYVTPAPPYKALQFLRDKALVGATRLQTITNTLDWARRLRHFVGSMAASNVQGIWQYRGPAPVSRIIDGTIAANFDASNPYHFTAGCWGTSGFLDSVLRVVNIPVDGQPVIGSLAHSATRFMTESLSLSHGDDPYINADIYGPPASAWLLSDATVSAWLVNPTKALISENIGRGNPEAMIKYLSGLLQWEYCSDPPGTPPASSKVLTISQFATRPDVYPLSYLLNLPPDPSDPTLPPSLWDRLAGKIAAQGGCSAAMAALGTQMNACFAVVPVAERLDCNW